MGTGRSLFQGDYSDGNVVVGAGEGTEQMQQDLAGAVQSSRQDEDWRPG